MNPDGYILLQAELKGGTLVGLVRGDLDGQEIWLDQGHGAITLEGEADLGFLSVTGHMRHVPEGSRLGLYFATPHGDMMLAGSFGLVRAWAEKHEPWREEIERALRSGGITEQGHHH